MLTLSLSIFELIQELEVGNNTPFVRNTNFPEMSTFPMAVFLGRTRGYQVYFLFLPHMLRQYL